MIDPVEASSDAVAEISNLIAQDHVWLNELERASNESAPLETDALGRFGAKTGLFVVLEGSGEVFTPTVQLHVGTDGHILDGHGRQVLGFLSGAPVGKPPTALRVPQSVTQRFARYELDDRGLLFGVGSQTEPSTQTDRVDIGRLCMAFFPAPQELKMKGNDDFIATAPAGKPRLVPSDAPNVASLDRQASSAEIAKVRESAQQTWVESARAELEVALASSKDVLVRVALDTVK
jgi:flagellar basal body rod protein FlgG